MRDDQNRESLLPPPPTESFGDVKKIVRDLRSRCPWDRKQTHESLAPHILEEAYEAKEAIEDRDDIALKGELGDMLLHVLMHSLIAEERNAFTFDEVVQTLAEKLVRRHPHVYNNTGDEELTEAEVRENWEQLKMKEGRTSIFDGMPRSLPALQRAERVQQKGADIGFDWPEVTGVWEKIEEELGEFRQELQLREDGESDRVSSEFGDLLFSLVNLSRWINVRPEEALQGTTNRFIARFREVEEMVAAEGGTLKERRLEELDELWNRAKENEKKG